MSVYDGPEPLTWDWWTQGAIPIALGVISILITVLALVVAIGANATAHAALDLSRDHAEKEAGEREQDRQQVLWEKRDRIRTETMNAFRDFVLSEPLPMDGGEAFTRMLPVIGAARRGCIREGLPRERRQAARAVAARRCGRSLGEHRSRESEQ